MPRATASNLTSVGGSRTHFAVFIGLDLDLMGQVAMNLWITEPK